MRHGIKFGENWFHICVTKADEGCFVSHLVAVVWRAEDGDTLAVVLHDVSLVLNFVRANNKLQIVVS